MLWPAKEEAEIAHRHDDLPENHPHLAEGERLHAHEFVIDAQHKRWPR
jgi:hypothetical protein